MSNKPLLTLGICWCILSMYFDIFYGFIMQQRWTNAEFVKSIIIEIDEIEEWLQLSHIKKKKKMTTQCEQMEF